MISTATWTELIFSNGNGASTIYDATDLADWEANYGMVAQLSTTSTSVPEPATWIVLLIGMMTMLFCRDLVVT